MLPRRKVGFIVIISACALAAIVAALRTGGRPDALVVNPEARPRGLNGDRVDFRRRQGEGDDARNDYPYGVTQPIPSDANPHVASVAEAFHTGKFPERTSAMTLPKPFDAVAYKADPQKYLNTIEPGRVWQIPDPGPGVPRLVSQTPKFTEVEQGQPIVLKTRAIPGAPVTYTSFDLGAFQNRLSSVTVAADDKGVARATFTGTPGTIGMVNILAGSPMATSQIHFVVDVLPPRKTAPQAAAQ